MAILPLLLMAAVLLAWLSELLSPKSEKKTPEQEFGDAVAKYLTYTNKKEDKPS